LAIWFGPSLVSIVLKFIRPEKKFESFDHLKEQIAKDALGARAVLGLPRQ